ncbi:MAG: DHA1 family bicyclomycin/chloramphenicol resistance-like MFS transporter [Gammaproteobacteria bacterium]|jgi:DHA1 family bicyclomycin/chloramphenicol resistance-like MFS transporter
MVLAESGSIMSTDLYTPSLPYLTDFFSTTPELLKLTISLNLIAYGVAQLIYGPLSDRFGRRPIFLTTIILFAISSVACGLATTIDQLLIARVFQGFFAAAEVVMCLAVFKDLFTEKEQVKAYAVYGMAIALTPAIAPILGGYIHILLGWEFNFFLTALVGVLTTILIFYLLPESTIPDPHALKVKSILQNYGAVFSNKTFLVYGGLAGVALGFIYAFVTAAPFILITHFGVETQHFGYYQAAIVVAFFLGSLLATRLADNWQSIKVLNIGLLIAVTGAMMVTGLIFIGGLSPNSLTFAYMFIAFGIGPVFAVVPTKAMAAVEKSIGSAAGAFGCMEIGLSGIIAGMVSVIHDDTPGPLGLVIGLTAIGGVILGIAANRMETG